MSDQTALTRYEERFAQEAERYAGAETATGRFLSLKGGILTFDDQPMPGNQACVIVLDSVLERTYYASKYDPDAERNKPPVCYAFAHPGDEEEVGPHPSMQADLSYFKPQSDRCRDCAHNAWGSADTGRGKACGERRRLAILPAGYYKPRKGSRDFDLEIFTDLDYYSKTDIVYMKLPVTSVPLWAKYVTGLNTNHRRPPFGAITRIYVEPDQKSQFKVHFELLELLPPEAFETIFRRHEEAHGAIVFGYTPPSAEASAPRAGSVRR